jgi:transcriptional regulator with XRE-family HTH domain
MHKTLQTTNDLGHFIREARERSEMSIKRVSVKSGYTEQTITNLEKNRGSVNLATLLAIATAIGVKVSVSFEDRSNPIVKELH